MKTIIIVTLALLVLAVAGFSAGLNFQKTLPSASQSTLGANEQLEIQKAAITEIRTKMTNWAAFSGYSSGTSR